MKLYTIRTFKSAILLLNVYQQGPGDTSGHARDAIWKTQARKAKTWSDMLDAIYCVGGRWTEIAANDGCQP